MRWRAKPFICFCLCLCVCVCDYECLFLATPLPCLSVCVCDYECLFLATPLPCLPVWLWMSVPGHAASLFVCLCLWLSMSVPGHAPSLFVCLCLWLRKSVTGYAPFLFVCLCLWLRKSVPGHAPFLFICLCEFVSACRMANIMISNIISPSFNWSITSVTRTSIYSCHSLKKPFWCDEFTWALEGKCHVRERKPSHPGFAHLADKLVLDQLRLGVRFHYGLFDFLSCCKNLK